MKPCALALIALPDPTVDALANEYQLSYQPNSAGQPDLGGEVAAAAVALVTNGTTGCSAQLMERLPALKVISCFGAGYEKVDIEAARSRGIGITYAPGANAATVADHAIGFALALARGYGELTAAVKAGAWTRSRADRATLTGSTVGVIGMGRVGQLIAQRARAFDAHVHYFARTERKDIDATYHATVLGLAQASDFLIAACPGGKSTYHLVNQQVLAKLGKDGFLINVSRGTVVSTSDLVKALQEGLIAGAGVDVLEEEPDVPATLVAQDRLLITPHMAGRSPASFEAQKEVLLTSLREALDGRACTYAIPEMRAR